MLGEEGELYKWVGIVGRSLLSHSSSGEREKVGIGIGSVGMEDFWQISRDAQGFTFDLKLKLPWRRG